MTDKQIIIDYKNLCEYYSKEVGCLGTFDGSCIKEQCFTYKLLQQLQAKEQECEELKIYIESNEQQVKEVETLVMDNDRLINELDQLKAENEELKGIRDGNFIHALEEQKRADKYFKTLTEIKEIAEKQCICGVDCIDMKQILQKISECEE